MQEMERRDAARFELSEEQFIPALKRTSKNLTLPQTILRKTL